MTIIISVFVLLILAGVIYYFAASNQSGTEATENDAERFAKLLVSEIKLYNEQKISRGLTNNNLYESLQDEIEGARKIYKKRIAFDRSEKYFNDALVNILVDGDKNKLGANFHSANK